MIISIIIIGTVLGLIPIYLQNQSGSSSKSTENTETPKAIQISSSVSLSTNGKKKRQVTSANCIQYQTSLTSICNGLSNLNQCNTTNLNSYLKDYTTRSVSKI
jgi:hypothetical protein